MTATQIQQRIKVICHDSGDGAMLRRVLWEIALQLAVANEGNGCPMKLDEKD